MIVIEKDVADGQGHAVVELDFGELLALSNALGETLELIPEWSSTCARASRSTTQHFSTSRFGDSSGPDRFLRRRRAWRRPGARRCRRQHDLSGW